MLDVSGVSVLYGKARALDGVTLGVARGEVLALVGPNGAGKTTLLRAVMGLVACERGAIAFEGRSLDGQPAHRRARLGIGMVPEGRGLLPEFTVEQNLLVGASARPAGLEIRADLAGVYRLFPRLAERRRQMARSLSGGEGQMLAVGRALMGRPRLLLLDEPSSGLMPALVNEVLDTV
ncbi:MAG TPA: ATP-binding cassette domain-containing protein, partial [Methylomirabilota bacterium]|nr:ATP-binding cassette domain-containing protein [Methylomirabilota bacterium]